MGYYGNDKIFIDINRDIYLHHHYNVFIGMENRLFIKAYDVGIKNIRHAILSSLGEFFEREILINNNPIKESQLLAVSLLNGHTKNVDTSEIVFTNKFVDSCGMASHYISSMCIKTAFLEFFERQCLMLSFLAETPSIKLVCNDAKKIKSHNDYIKNFVDEIDYFDISLSGNLYVVIAIGLGSKYNAVGLGTAENRELAILKAQREVLQYFAIAKFKYDIASADSLNRSEGNLYQEQFERMNSDEIYSAYEYLYKNTYKEAVERKNKLNFFELVHSVCANANMHPYAVALPSFRMIPNLKTIKIFDTNWFPHMNVALFSENVFSRIERNMRCYLRRDKKILPFA